MCSGPGGRLGDHRGLGVRVERLEVQVHGGEVATGMLAEQENEMRVFQTERPV